jgi:NADH dehydrogenase
MPAVVYRALSRMAGRVIDRPEIFGLSAKDPQLEVAEQPVASARADDGQLHADRDDVTDLPAGPLRGPAADLDRTPAALNGRRHIVIVGGGFGGLACARALAGGDERVTVIDRRNHHLFQPLLYQVSTAALSPADIAVPIRQVLARAKNVDVVLADVSGLDTEKRKLLLLDGGFIPYDILVLATGSAYNYFAHSDWAEYAPAPKSIGDARRIRARLLKSFEDAESCAEPDRRAALLTMVVVGGGPTGVEMAGAVAELARCSLRHDFRRIDPTTARIILIEAGPRLLAAFPPALGVYSKLALERLGVEVQLNAAVEAIDSEGLVVAGRRVPTSNIIWGAGIRANPVADWLGRKTDRMGRLEVGSDLSVPGLPEVFALGDNALFLQDGEALPALAQVAQQQGDFLGKMLRSPARQRPAFRFRSRGDTAVIGRHAAVFVVGRWSLRGRLAWLLWALVHVYLLIGFERRLLVATQWVWRYFTFQRGARLID